MLFLAYVELIRTGVGVCFFYEAAMMMNGKPLCVRELASEKGV